MPPTVLTYLNRKINSQLSFVLFVGFQMQEGEHIEKKGEKKRKRT